MSRSPPPANQTAAGHRPALRTVAPGVHGTSALAGLRRLLRQSRGASVRSQFAEGEEDAALPPEFG